MCVSGKARFATSVCGEVADWLEFERPGDQPSVEAIAEDVREGVPRIGPCVGAGLSRSAARDGFGYGESALRIDA